VVAVELDIEIVIVVRTIMEDKVVQVSSEAANQPVTMVTEIILQM
jgi:hypothetical protein